MQKNKTLYVAYGSNMNVEQMQHRCPTAKVVTNMFLEGYRLRFMGGHYSAVATIEPSDDDLVPKSIPKMNGIWISTKDTRICIARKL